MPSQKRRRSSLLRSLWTKITRPDKAIWDVGSVRTRVMVAGKIVFDEPTCLAIRADTKEVIATGERAYALLGSGSQLVRLVFPFQRGCVADSHYAVLWLRSICQQLWPNRRWLPFSFSPGGSFILSSTIGQADTAVWTEVFSLAGLHFVTPFLAEAALPLLINVPESEALWAVVAGGDHSVIVLVQGGRVIQSQLLFWGGISLTEAVQEWLANEKGVQVSWKTAESLKLHWASYLHNSHNSFSFQGKNPGTQLGLSMTISVDELHLCMIKAAQPLVIQLKQFLASLSAQQAVTCLENGLWLAGGGCQVMGLDSWLASQLGCAVSMIDKPSVALLDATRLSAMRTQETI